MSWDEAGCCWDYRNTYTHVAYASYYSDCGTHLSTPQKITHSTTCYIVCPNGERDCEEHFGIIFWLLMAFFVIMVLSIIASACSKCKERRAARAAMARNIAAGGDGHNNSIIVG